MRVVLEGVVESLHAMRPAWSRKLCLVGAAFALASGAGCSSGDDPDNSGSSGGPSAGSGTTAGTSATGGSGAAGSASGGVPSVGGISGLAGKAGMSSGGSGSASGGSGGSGGTSAAGGNTGGSSGAGTGGSAGGGSNAAANPSPGCSKGTARPAGGKVETVDTLLHLFPASYDGKKPFPLLIALHACGNKNTEFVGHTDPTNFATEFVRTMPNTPDGGQCWSNYGNDIKRITEQFDDLVNNYCIDLNRVFGIGHSSGAQMLVNILSHKSDTEHLHIKAVAPVAADPYNVAEPMPVLYIDGIKDNQRSADSAKNTVAKFRAANSCADTSKPYTPVMSCQSTDQGSGRPMVDPGCIIYDNCKVPTIWCAHNDPNYSGTQHGVPCFAMKATWDFFATL